MATLLTVIDVDTGDVRISWTAPYDNEQTITAYEILVQDKMKTQYFADTINCDG